MYERYGVDKYLYAVGLSVDPEYRGYGLGKDILKVRYDLCKISSHLKNSLSCRFFAKTLHNPKFLKKTFS